MNLSPKFRSELPGYYCPYCGKLVGYIGRGFAWLLGNGFHDCDYSNLLGWQDDHGQIFNLQGIICEPIKPQLELTNEMRRRLDKRISNQRAQLRWWEDNCNKHIHGVARRALPNYWHVLRKRDVEIKILRRNFRYHHIQASILFAIGVGIGIAIAKGDFMFVIGAVVAFATLEIAKKFKEISGSFKAWMKDLSRKKS